MKLFMSGQKFQLAKEPAGAVLIKKFLDSSKDGELFNSAQVADAIGRQTKTVQYALRFLDDYTAGGTHGKMRYYGKPATIRELCRQLAKETK